MAERPLAGQPQSALGELLGTRGVNPIWAERKYSREGIMKMLAHSGGLPEGMDCANMRPVDGAGCAAFEWREPSPQ